MGAVEHIAAVVAAESTAEADIAAEHTVAVAVVALEVAVVVEGERIAAAAERTGVAAAVEGVGPAGVAIPARWAALRSLLRMPVAVVARGPPVAPEVRSVAPEAQPLRKQQPP